MAIQVKEVASRKELRQFIKYPLVLYARDPCFVPHLLIERKKFFSDSNPIFAFTEPRYFLARDESGGIAGRISAHVNRRHNEFSGESTGFFGFFESVDRFEVARALLSAAEEWLARKGMSVIRGPFNFSTNQECGFLVQGFDEPPAIMMPYTKPYYPDFMSRLGYSAVKELLAYEMLYKGAIPDYLVRFSRRVEERTNVLVRTVSTKTFLQDVHKAFSVYNRAWQDNWGFVPMTEEQFRYTAENLKSIVDPNLALLAEINGEPVAFSLALPDYNPLFKRMGGRLFPFGIFIFLVGRRSVCTMRVITLGVVQEHRKRGIEILLIYHTFKNGRARGYGRAELSWVLADNVLLRRTVERAGAVPYKTYRIYEKEL